MSALRVILEHAYEAFNAQDTGRMAVFVHPDAAWPNTMATGEAIIGKDAVISHFERVFATLRPNIQIISVTAETAGSLTVEVQYAVETVDGQVWSDTRAELCYHFRDGLITGMTILSGF